MDNFCRRISLYFPLLKIALCLILSFISTQVIYSQNNVLFRGIVKDSITSEPLKFINVYLPAQQRGVYSDNSGEFKIYINRGINLLNVSSVGYKSKDIIINTDSVKSIEILLSPNNIALEEIVVKPGKERYSKKNNPAVELMKKVRSKMEVYSPYVHNHFSREKYEKTIFALNDFHLDSSYNGKFKFISEYIDTSDISGKPILIASLTEKVSTEIYRKTPKTNKEIIEGFKQSSVVDVFDQKSLQKFIDEILCEVDIFQNDITIMQNHFVSPLSSIAPNYYKFYLNDTISIDGEKCIELSFTPHNKESFGFIGRLYIPIEDTTMFVKKAVLNIPKVINLNYIKSIYIVQDFIKSANGSRLKVNDDMTAEFELMPNTQGIYTRRQIRFNNFSFIVNTDFDNYLNLKSDIIMTDLAEYQPEEFWNKNRKIHVNSKENSMNGFLSRLRDIPFFYWTEQLIKVIISGYIPTSSNSKFDIGPVNTFISTNKIEGWRFRIGGVTTALLNNHLFSRGYLAYGTADKKLKYGIELEYSFDKKENHSREFPINSIKIEHQYDIDPIGQHYLFTNKDNIFLSLKRKTDDKATYRRLSNIRYKLEQENGFSFDIGFNHKIQEVTKYLPFEDGYGNVFASYAQSAFCITLRYAPGEKFYQTKSDRIPINIDAPIFQLSHDYGPKGMFGNKFTLNKTELSVQKRFWFSAFGYTDIILKAGKIWGNVQYPDLIWPNANLSYTIQKESYSLMNAMEFANDQYFSWDITYWGNGVLFNRIPIINCLKLREVVTFKGLYGSLTDKNNPNLNNSLYRFPYNTFTKTMGKDPYMEISIGIDNILTFIRLDYVWRLTYRNTPNVDKSGLRIQLHFTF